MSDFQSGVSTAVILAAGNGTRMGAISDFYAKPALQIGNKTSIEHILSHMKKIDVKHCIIVVGHKSGSVIQLIGDGVKFGISVEYVFQDVRLGLANAISSLRSYIRGSFILFLGDIYYQDLKIENLYQEFLDKRASAVIGSKIEHDESALKLNFSIKCDAQGKVVEVIEKPTKLINEIKGCGVYIFTIDIFDAVNRTPRSALRDEYELTDSIQLLINSGGDVYHFNCTENDRNVSTPIDLLEINMDYLEQKKLSHHYSEQVNVGESVYIDNVVAGNNALIGDGASLRNCVVLANSIVDKNINAKNCIFYEHKVLQL